MKAMDNLPQGNGWIEASLQGPFLLSSLVKNLVQRREVSHSAVMRDLQKPDVVLGLGTLTNGNF